LLSAGAASRSSDLVILVNIIITAIIKSSSNSVPCPASPSRSDVLIGPHGPQPACRAPWGQLRCNC
jgi:hypothetical protein